MKSWIFRLSWNDVGILLRIYVSLILKWIVIISLLAKGLYSWLPTDCMTFHIDSIYYFALSMIMCLHFWQMTPLLNGVVILYSSTKWCNGTKFTTQHLDVMYTFWMACTPQSYTRRNDLVVMYSVPTSPVFWLSLMINL